MKIQVRLAAVVFFGFGCSVVAQAAVKCTAVCEFYSPKTKGDGFVSMWEKNPELGMFRKEVSVLVSAIDEARSRLRMTCFDTASAGGVDIQLLRKNPPVLVDSQTFEPLSEFEIVSRCKPTSSL